jgi:DivIVA domain-containing protein
MSLSQRLHEVAFSEALRGYDRTEVDRFLVEITASVDQLLLRMRALEAGAAHPAGDGVPGETTVARALVLAQRAADIATAEANDSAQRTRQQAEAEAARILREARTEAAAVRETARSDAEATMIDLEQRRDPLVKGLAALHDRAVKYRDGLREILSDQLVVTDAWLAANPGATPSAEPTRQGVWTTALDTPSDVQARPWAEDPGAPAPAATPAPSTATPIVPPVAATPAPAAAGAPPVPAAPATNQAPAAAPQVTIPPPPPTS